MILLTFYLLIGVFVTFIVKNIEIVWGNEYFIKVTQNNFLLFLVCTTLWLPLIIIILFSNSTVEVTDDDDE